MPSKDFILHRGIRITKGDKATMVRNSPFGNGDDLIEVEVVRFKKSSGQSIGLAASVPIEGWHDLGGVIPYGRGYWIGPNDLLKYFRLKRSPHPLASKKVKVKDFKFRRKDLSGMRCKVLASLPDGKSSFVEMAEDIGGCGSDGLGKAGHCIVVPNDRLVEEKPKKSEASMKSKSK